MDDTNPQLSLSDRFSRAAQWTSQQCGRAYTFVAAIVIIAIWAISGPAFHYSDTWQLIINTGTTIITFLMVFLIQNTQNRDTTAIQLKLDELIRANENARNQMLRLEDLTENQIKHLKESFATSRPSRPSGDHWKPPNRDLQRFPRILRRQRAVFLNATQAASAEAHDPYAPRTPPFKEHQAAADSPRIWRMIWLCWYGFATNRLAPKNAARFGLARTEATSNPIQGQCCEA